MDFDEALQRALDSDSGDPVLLLGNGFSRGYSADFGYDRLRDVVDMEDLEVPKGALFDHAGSDDFETVINNLHKSAELIELYDPDDEDLRRMLREDAQVVKRGLVEAIARIHPASSAAISAEQYDSAREFLSHFREIFTVNYDLLLYWTVNQPTGAETVRRDGFARPEGVLIWRRPLVAAGQEIYWLHGAVHFHVQDGRVRKLESGSGRLMDQLQYNLTEGRYPLVVTEGSREDKEARIARSAYLTYCHQRLRQASGTMFIHGMALSENDNHILEALTVKESEVSALYVGVFGPRSRARREVETRALGLVEDRKANGGASLDVQLYDAGSVAIWGES